MPLAYPALWENKALGAASWKDVVKRGLTLSKPVYAAQIALYQSYLELPNPALFTALNRDTMELYSELVPFDPSLAQTMSDRAVEVVRAALGLLGSRAHDLAERGLVHLVQHRHGPEDYSYFAVARARGKGALPDFASHIITEEAA